MKGVVAVIRNQIQLINGSGSMIQIEEGHKRSQKRGNKINMFGDHGILCYKGRIFSWSLEAFIEAQEEMNRK